MSVKVSSKLKEYIKKLEIETYKALTESGMVVETSAKKLTPVDMGRLRNSIGYKVGKEKVVAKDFRGGDPDDIKLNSNEEYTVVIGSNVVYARYQHEGMELNHTVGGSKFLLRGLNNNTTKIGKIFTKRIGGIKI